MLQFIPWTCNVTLVKATPRPYHHGNLREALLRAAEKTLETGGVQSISLRELSRELGVSHTSPRRHFANKQALLDALALRGFERLDEISKRAAKDSGKNLIAHLTKLGRAYVGFAVKHPALLSLMFESKHRLGAPRELLEASDRALSHMRAVLASGQAKGEIVAGDPVRLSIVVGALLQGLVTISTHGKVKGISLDTLVGEVIERLVLGLRPRGGRSG